MQVHCNPGCCCVPAGDYRNERLKTEEPPLAPLADGVLTVAQIVAINVVLSGDNALVIALTAQQLPTPLRRKAVFWGSALAVILQVVFAILVARLLEVPGLRLAGALALLMIARKLISDPRDEAQSSATTRSVLGAVLAILVANLAMSFDNVVAVGAISHGFPALIAVGVLVSAVMLLAASSIVVTLIERYRWMTSAGAALLACTAAGMICEEPILAGSLPFESQAAAAMPTESMTPSAATMLDERTSYAQPVIAGAAHGITERLTLKWSVAVYALAISLCFAKFRWWHAEPGFVPQPDHDAAVVACVPE
jgi:YjbE family integral membrane protein